MKEHASDTVSLNDRNLGSLIARLAHTIHAPHYPAGDRAALRRWAPGLPVPLAFYRLWLRHVGGDPPPEYQTPVWMGVIWAIATLGAGGNTPNRPFGQALAESGFSEGRLERLLSAPEDKRLELFMSAVRFLAAKGEGFDLAEGARLLLTTDPEKRDSLHRRVASYYYRYSPAANE